MNNSDTPNLLKIRRLNSNEIGDANPAVTTINNSKSIGDEGVVENKLSKKPPLDKEKRQQQHQQAAASFKPSTATAIPSMQGWLYKMKEPHSTASLSSSSSSSSSRKPYLSSSSSSLNTLNNSSSSSNDFNVQKSKKPPKWKNYW